MDQQRTGGAERATQLNAMAELFIGIPELSCSGRSGGVPRDQTAAEFIR